MASVLQQPRRPFAALDSTRLQALGSIKNRQNGIAQSNTGSPVKSQLNTPVKRRLSPEPFEDELDTENIDPNILFSPSKKGKAVDGTPYKSSTITLTATPKYSPFERFGQTTGTTLSPKPKPKALSVSVPTTTNTTPISHSRGSPKHKRVGLLNAKRRLSSPYRRIDPPSSNSPSSLPFTIDAALSGTLSSYKAKPSPPADAAPAMPASWFFAIHEDTPEEEAANLMEHSASTLDISSDEDCATRRHRLDADRGKENVPPEGWSAPARARAAAHADARVHRGVCAEAKRVAAAAAAAERMEEDRGPLREMDAADFYPEGVDESDGVVVADEKDERKSVSPLSKETFDFEVEGPPSPSRELEEAAVIKGDIAILADEL